MDDDVEQLPRPFGPYLLLARLARGGMGEVYLAKHGGLQGFEKHCVVKTLRQELSNEAEYIGRFSEEARVVVQLSHRNVCAVFDVGRVAGQLYVAMEHLIGRDLRLVVQRAPLTPALAVHVISEVLEALDYAHRFVEPDNEQPLGLVHRDVSPHNVLLGVEGDVKLIDFGIATTKRQGPLTDSGSVLGKLTYMAPEHARGDPTDGRADQYSAAVLFTELMTGVGFMDEMSRDEAWRIAGIGGFRPRCFAQLEPELRTVIDRALQADRNKRYATCSELGDAIVQWARARGHVADARDVRRLMGALFPEFPAQVRSVARAFVDVHPPALDVVAKTPGFETIATTMMVAPTTAGLSESPNTVLVRDRDRPAAAPQTSTSALAPARRPLLAAAALTAAALLGAAAAALVPARDEQHTVVSLPPDPPPETAPAPPPASVAPAVASGSDSEPEAVDEEPARPPSSASSSSSPKGARPPKGKTSAKLGADTKRDLAYLQERCVDKVPCAREALDWARRKLSDSDRDQLAELAKDCSRKCKLK